MTDLTAFFFGLAVGLLFGLAAGIVFEANWWRRH